jgi:hypothetical protein
MKAPVEIMSHAVVAKGSARIYTRLMLHRKGLKWCYESEEFRQSLEYLGTRPGRRYGCDMNSAFCVLGQRDELTTQTT